MVIVTRHIFEMVSGKCEETFKVSLWKSWLNIIKVYLNYIITDADVYDLIWLDWIQNT